MSGDGKWSPGACPVRVRLSCGHVIKRRSEPMNDRAKCGCTHGKGCGYSLAWTESWQVETPHLVYPNPLIAAQKEETLSDSPEAPLGGVTDERA